MNSEAAAVQTTRHDPYSSLAFTVEEVGRRLNLGRTTVFWLIKTQQLRSMLVGRSRRISAAALAEFIAKCESNSMGDNDEQG
jgi:excisionase family DNA binding protein